MLFSILLLCNVFYAVVTQETSSELPQTKSVTQEITNTTLVSKAIKTCSDSEWQCTNGDCINKEDRCNAVVNCRDASDEYLDTCEGTVRPIFRLQLLCSISSKSQRFCPQICYNQPAFCYYALMAENGIPNTCRFPRYPAHGKYTVQPLAGQLANKGFSLDYTCDQSYTLVETEKHICVYGTWLNGEKPHYCTETCRLYTADNFTYVCQDSPCGDHVSVGTVVNVTRKETERNPPVSIQILCNEDKELIFNMSMDCVNEVENLLRNSEGIPTTNKIVEYESKFNQHWSETSHQFQKLVEEFRLSEDELRRNMDMMDRMLEQCDMYLDLVLYNLSMKQGLV